MKEALISAFPQQQNLPPEQIERNENVLYIEEEDSIGSASFKYAEY